MDYLTRADISLRSMRYMKYLINPHNPSIEEIRLNVLKGERIGLCARIDRINSKVSLS